LSKVDEIEVPFVENIFEGDEENLMLKNFIDTNIKKEEEKFEIEDFMPSKTFGKYFGERFSMKF